MMNSEPVSLDTALQLYAQGFSQPKPFFGSLWYIWDDISSDEEEPCIPAEWKLMVCTNNDCDDYPDCKFGFHGIIEDGGVVYPGDINKAVFAPTALQVLPKDLHIGQIDNPGVEVWSVVDQLAHPSERLISKHVKSAEAGALAWFAWNHD